MSMNTSVGCRHQSSLAIPLLGFAALDSTAKVWFYGGVYIYACMCNGALLYDLYKP